jgi:membrane-associated phospholipid phosphatase
MLACRKSRSAAIARRIAAIGIALMPMVAFADDSGQRRAGDVLSYALPLTTLGVEWGRGDGRGALQLAESFGATVVVTEVFKRTIKSERPDHTNDESFPSGHATRAFAAATYVHRRHGFGSAWPLYALSVYVGHTRVAAQRHRWGDVAGAAAIAAASSWWLVEPKQTAGMGTAWRPKGITLTMVVALP